MRFAPIASYWSFCSLVVPWMDATMAMTDATPMMMPSMVSSERILLLSMDLRAMRTV